VGALSGYMITVYNVTVLCTYAASTESSSKDLLFGYDHTTTTTYWYSQRDMMHSKTTDITYIFSATPSSSAGACPTSIENKAFYMWSSGAFDGGWSCDVYVTYAYTKIL